MYRLIGTEVSEENYNKFILLKDVHLKNKKRLQDLNKNKIKSSQITREVNKLRFTSVNEVIPYKEQYKHPLWQRMRLLIMQRDKFRCRACNNEEQTLNVHHIRYNRKSFVWDVPDYYLVTLCEDCHRKEHGLN